MGGEEEKYRICIDTVGNASLNGGMTSVRENKKGNPMEAMYFNGISQPQRRIYTDNLTPN